MQFSLRPNCSKLCRACLPLQGKHHKRYNGRQKRNQEHDDNENQNKRCHRIPGLFPSACRSINRPGLFLLNPAPGLIPAAAVCGHPASRLCRLSVSRFFNLRLLFPGYCRIMVFTVRFVSRMAFIQIIIPVHYNRILHITSANRTIMLSLHRLIADWTYSFYHAATLLSS